MTPATTPPTAIPVPPELNGDELLYEVVNGEIVEKVRMGVYETNVTWVLLGYLSHFIRAHNLGRAGQEMLFVLDLTRGLKRRPDGAFVSYARWPKNRRVPRAEAWDVVPNLALEVVSTSNSAEEILVKVHEYFRAGVELVWVIYPEVEEIYVYRSATDPHVLTRADELDGGDVVPGFRLPVATLFEDGADDTAPLPA